MINGQAMRAILKALQNAGVRRGVGEVARRGRITQKAAWEIVKHSKQHHAWWKKLGTVLTNNIR